MKYLLQITERAVKAYEKLHEPYKSQIKKRIDALKKTGAASQNVKPLVGELKGLYRLRSGDYRIIFEMQDEVITIIAIVHRKEAYE
ncbi:MAG TPA: type II toxin-antitoxin system RelE/ParE family toxin [Spirochaetota bacterium]|nr:type II toxin-antitoxin system RelE/ParE family toxin [Spirochaetota bacterium]